MGVEKNGTKIEKSDNENQILTRKRKGKRRKLRLVCVIYILFMYFVDIVCK